MKKFLSAIWNGWKKFAHVLGIINTRVLLTISYFVIVALVSVVARLFGADFLGRRKHEEDYWHEREPVDASLEAVRRQF